MATQVWTRSPLPSTMVARCALMLLLMTSRQNTGVRRELLLAAPVCHVPRASCTSACPAVKLLSHKPPQASQLGQQHYLNNQATVVTTRRRHVMIKGWRRVRPCLVPRWMHRSKSHRLHSVWLSKR